MKNVMSEALRNKRARGLDLTILIGGAEPVKATVPVEDAMKAVDGMPDQDGIGVNGEGEGDEMGMKLKQKEAGLAPEATEISDRNMASEKMGGMDGDTNQPSKDKMIIGEELAKAGLGKSSLAHRAFMGKGK